MPVQVWHVGLTKQQLEKLESIQRRALNIIYPDLSYTGLPYHSQVCSGSTNEESLAEHGFFQGNAEAWLPPAPPPLTTAGHWTQP